MLRASTLLLIASLCSPLAGFAQNPEVQPWLDKMIAFYDKMPMRSDFTMEMKIEQQGMAIELSGSGTTTMASATRSRAQIAATVNIPGMGEIETTTLTVSDGENLWTEMDNPMMGGKMVTKMTFEEAEAIAEQSGMSVNMNQASFSDPAQQMKNLMEVVDFDSVEIDGNEVRLTGKMSESFTEMMGEASAELGEGFRQMVFLIDRDSGRPLGMTWGDAEKPFLTMSITNTELLDSVPDEVFEYEPPEGVEVMEPAKELLQQG